MTTTFEEYAASRPGPTLHDAQFHASRYAQMFGEMRQYDADGYTWTRDAIAAYLRWRARQEVKPGN